MVLLVHPCVTDVCFSWSTPSCVRANRICTAMGYNVANTPPLPVPRLDVDIGTLYYRLTDQPSLLILSSPEPQKLDGQDRLTEVGHSVDSGVFQAFRGFVLSMCCCWLTQGAGNNRNLVHWVVKSVEISWNVHPEIRNLLGNQSRNQKSNPTHAPRNL